MEPINNAMSPFQPLKRFLQPRWLSLKYGAIFPVTLLALKFLWSFYANLTIAKAKAEALRIQNVALAQIKEVLKLRRIEVEKIKAEKWSGALPTAIYAGAPIPFLNVGNSK